MECFAPPWPLWRERRNLWFFIEPSFALGASLSLFLLQLVLFFSLQLCACMLAGMRWSRRLAITVVPVAQTFGDICETKPYDTENISHLVTVTVEEDQINTPTCSPGTFIWHSNREGGKGVNNALFHLLIAQTQASQLIFKDLVFFCKFSIFDDLPSSLLF